MGNNPAQGWVIKTRVISAVRFYDILCGTMRMRLTEKIIYLKD